MAKDIQDCNRWIAGLEFFRKDFLKSINLPYSHIETTVLPPTFPAQALGNSKRLTLKVKPYV
jgi:hypothetical protein